MTFSTPSALSARDSRWRLPVALAIAAAASQLPSVAIGATTPTTPDTTAPTVTATVSGSWNALPVAPTITATDNVGGSGVNQIEYRIRRASGIGFRDQGVYLAGTTTVKLADGERVEARATDVAGNLSGWVQSGNAKVDTHAPTTTASSVSTSWTNAPITVALSEGDAPEFTDSDGSGVTATYYRLAGAGVSSTAWLTYDEETSLPTLGNGEWLEYYSRDAVGNTQGAQRTGTARVDTVAPVVTFDPAEIDSDDWRTEALPVTVHLNDALSGIGTSNTDATYTVYRDGDEERSGTVAEGDVITLNHDESLKVVVRDRAGNETELSSNEAAVDGKAPTTTSNVPTSGYVTAVPFEVLLSADDESDDTNGSVGVANIYYQVLNADLQPLADPVEYDGGLFVDAGQRVTFYSVDELGNREDSFTTAAIKADGTAPQVTVSGLSSDWVNADPEVTLTATDSESGIDSLEYTILDEFGTPVGGMGWTTYDEPITLEHGQSVQYIAFDKAGNTAGDTTVSAQVDTISPTASASTVPSAWGTTPVSITLTGNDVDSGLDKLTYEVIAAGGAVGPTLTYSSASKPSLGNGESLRFRAIDQAGNRSVDQSTGAAKVDTTAPVTTAAGVPATPVSAPVAVTLSSSDAQSGVKSIQYVIVTASGADAGPAATYSAAAAPTLTDGQSLRYWAVDNVGNTEAPQRTSIVRVGVPTPSADFALNASNRRVIVDGDESRVTVGCGVPGCRVRVAVRFRSANKTLVSLAPVVVDVPAGGTKVAKLAITAAQLRKVRRLLGANGEGGEARITYTRVDASGNPLSGTQVTRRGLRTSVIR